jgi:LAO/AO transport system kinase
MKAGLAELPDLVLVTKGDSGRDAERTAAEIRGALSLAAARAPPVAIVSARTGQGLAAVPDLLAGFDRLQRQIVRRDQARAWVESQIRVDFGRFGAAIVESQLREGGESPFRLWRNLSRLLRDRLERPGATA